MLHQASPRSLQFLLRLPAPLRREAFSRVTHLTSSFARPNHSNSISPITRFFSSTRIQVAQKKPKATSKSQPSDPSSPSARSHPTRPPPLSQSKSPPLLSSQPRYSEAYARRLLGDTDRVLLYKAPNHTFLYLISYFCGFSFLVGGANTISFAFYVPPGTSPENRSLRWYTRIMVALPGIFIGVLSIVFMVTPTRLLKTVSLVRHVASSSSSSSPVKTTTAAAEVAASSNLASTATAKVDEVFLRFETRGLLPFSLPGRQGNVIDSPANTVRMDRQITAVDLVLHNVRLSRAKEFTAENPERPSDVKKEKGAAPSFLRSIIRALVNTWPTLKVNVRKMFLRDGFAYLEIQHEGVWKLDLNGCEILDEGTPLEELTLPAPGLDRSFLGRMKALLKL